MFDRHRLDTDPDQGLQPDQHQHRRHQHTDLTVSNPALNPAQTVSFTDTLPAGLRGQRA
ncbi:MAG: hypothetical protein IPN04_02870 [Rhodoferax sp.]|nr:hypothetical protein [Rhodoferax sp.]